MKQSVKRRAKPRPSSSRTRSLDRLERVVTVLVEAQLADGFSAPPNLIERLRRMEYSVRAAGGDRQTLQVIASGRRLLGDAEEPTPPEPDIAFDLRDLRSNDGFG